MSELRFTSPASTSLDELVQLRSEAALLQRNVRRAGAAPQTGETQSRRLGRGLDFAELREYQAGDDVRLIDWKVTARTGKPHTKLFIEERERPVYLVVDFRAAMRFGTQGSYKSVLASRLAAIVGWHAVAAGDRVGGVVFTDDWQAEIKPQGGRRGLMRLFQSIMQGQNRIPRGSEISLGDTLERVAKVAHPGSAVRIFSDFAGVDSRCATALGGPLANHGVLGIHVMDPMERALPVKRMPILAAVAGAKQNSGQRVLVGGASQRRQYVLQHQRDVSRLTNVFSRGRHRLVPVHTEQPLLDNAAAVLREMGAPTYGHAGETGSSVSTG